MSDPLRIAVLMGGETHEREISLISGKAVAYALSQAGHDVSLVDLHDPVTQVLCDAVREADVVFPALHGGAGEDGRMQTVLESAGIVYVGSRPVPSARAMDKEQTKEYARMVDVPTVREAVFVAPTDLAEILSAAEDLGAYPIVLKPLAEGSAVGVTIAQNEDELSEAWNDILCGTWMLEPFIAGRELTVPILWDEACPVIEIRPKDGFYDYTNKYTAGCTEYDCPAKLPKKVAERVASDALRLYRALQLRDMARIDFRLDARKNHFLLEANTIPGMTSTSLLPMGAKARGLTFVEMCDRLCRVAFERGISVS